MSYQTFYLRSFSPITDLSIVAIIIAVFACIHVYTMYTSHSPVTYALNLVASGLVGGALVICVVSILLDPSMYWTTKKQVGGGGVDAEANGSGVERIISVRRPIMGFKSLERRIEMAGDVWEDGLRYEQALNRK